MADGQAAIAYSVTPYSGTKAAVPPKGTTTGGTPSGGQLTFELQPVGDDSYYEPGTWNYPISPTYQAKDIKSVILNIETTGIKPWESRIICISAIDLGDPLLPVIHFIDKDELQMVKGFLDWFNYGGFNEVIGYNVAFDIRFLFVTAMKYQLKWSQLAEVDLYDLQQVMEQVFAKFVYGNNPSGKLDDWAKYLFATEPPISQEAVLEAWVKEDFTSIKNFNEYKVYTCLDMISTIDYVLTP